MDILVIDDVIPTALQNTFEKIFLGSDFPVYLNTGTVLYVENSDNKDLFHDKNTKDSAQFTHAIIRNEIQTSEYWSLIRPLLYFVIAKTNKELEIVRCKINITCPHAQYLKTQYFPPHIDAAPNANFTAIYYVNDSDGDTLFFETPNQNIINGEFIIKQQVTPKKGRMVFFNKDTVHCGKPPSHTDARCVININFKLVA